MTSRDFCYWLQGFFEVSDATALDVEQVALVRRHLNMVFFHEIDPSYGDAEHQKVLAALHVGDVKPDKPEASGAAEGLKERVDQLEGAVDEAKQLAKSASQKAIATGRHDALIRC